MHKYVHSWKELLRQLEQDRARLWNPIAASDEALEDEEEIEQNQYLWAEYIGDIGAS